MRVLAFDPGNPNFAWGVIDSSNLYFASGVLQVSGKNPVELVRQISQEVSNVIVAYIPDMIVIERYMTRRHANINNELINLLIGSTLCTSQFAEIPVEALTPAVWKTHFHRRFGLETNVVKIQSKVDHEVDALLMAAYVLSKHNYEAAIEVMYGFGFAARLAAVTKGRKGKLRALPKTIQEVKQTWKTFHTKSSKGRRSLTLAHSIVKGEEN